MSQVVGAEVGAVVREVVPSWLLPAFVPVTHLGSVGFLLAVFVLECWFGDRERGVRALGVFLGSVALVVALKAVFALPRPAGGGLVAVSGYGFPSGHAVQATVGYGLLARGLDRWSARARTAVAATLIVLVVLSRVVLEVHYVRDVVAGVVVGTAVLAVGIVLLDRAPRWTLVPATGLGAAAFLATGGSHDGAAVFGATLGATIAWEGLGAGPPVETTRQRVALLGGVFPVLGALGYVTAYSQLPVPAVFVLAGGVMALFLSGPRLARRTRAGRSADDPRRR